MQGRRRTRQTMKQKTTKAILAGVAALGLCAMVLVPQIEEDTVPPDTGTVAHVIDGDTLVLRGREGSIRLWGVDAPEKDESGFLAAKNALARMVQAQPLQCQQLDIDRYGRSVARCFRPDGQEINRMMIESGTATEYRYFSGGFYSR